MMGLKVLEKSSYPITVAVASIQRTTTQKVLTATTTTTISTAGGSSSCSSRSAAFLFSPVSMRKRNAASIVERRRSRNDAVCSFSFYDQSTKWTSRGFIPQPPPPQQRGRTFMTTTTTTTRRGTITQAIPLGIAIQEQQNNNITATTVTSSSSSSSSSSSILPPNVTAWLDLSLPEGRCMGVSSAGIDFFPVDVDTNIDDEEDDGSTNKDEYTRRNDNHHRSEWMKSVFHPLEIEYGFTLKKSRASFWLGRLALRLVLNFPDYPILRDSYGRPQLTQGTYGSISHKQDKGIALVSQSRMVEWKDNDGYYGNRLAGVGIDLELTSRPGRPSVASRVLTEREREALGGIPGISVEEEVLLRFR
jgi:hypothetical protein